jgi:hypothetical protein
MSDTFRRICEQHEAFLRLAEPLGNQWCRVDPLSDVYNKLGIGSTTIRFLQEEEERRKLLAGIIDIGAVANLTADAERQLKLLEGPIEEARRLGLLDSSSDIRSSLAMVMEVHQNYERLFSLPELAEVNRFVKEAMEADGLAKSLFAAASGNSVLQAAIAGMQNPWLNVEHAKSSVQGLIGIFAIGHGLNERAPFDAEFADVLRPCLGDWRDFVSLPHDLLADPILRTGLYHERGFDPALTDFTAPAFDEGVRQADLRPPPSLTEVEEEEQDGRGDGFARARQAFNELQRFEIVIRRFIVRVMSAAFGEGWMKRQLPNGMLDRWIGKREALIKSGQSEHPLIDYADFTDYRQIIERKDNWDQVFKPVFGRPEDVRESFQRLFPVRIATMHARIVTLDDELLLLVETKRVLKAIGKA